MVHVFISSTREDIGRDCREIAIQAVQICDAVPVTMETWDADYDNAVGLCREKIFIESSHFLGIIAYRYGWVPPEKTISITEAEFNWAKKSGKPMVVFIPNPGLEYAKELRQRAANQSETQIRAQSNFRTKIMEQGACQLFKDTDELSMRITRKIMIWSMGGLRSAVSRKEIKKGKPDAFKIGPNEYPDLIKLGRRRQTREFEDIIASLNEPDCSNIAGVLIAGATGNGHAEMINRFLNIFEEQTPTQPQHYRVAVGALWRQNSLGRLLNILEMEMEADAAGCSMEMLALRLRTKLDVSDVIVEIKNLQRIDGDLPKFIAQFWRPFVKYLEKELLKHRLIVLLSYENVISVQWDKYFQHPPDPDDGIAGYSAGKLIRLADLTPFKTRDVHNWLVERLPRDDAASVAETLIQETGGHPQILYSKLRQHLAEHRQRKI